MPTTTPRRIDKIVATFCRSINPTATPVYVTVAAAPGAQPNECFFNVRQKTEADGGRIAYGWAVWIWPRVYIEAEHHAVWATPESKLLDVTPRSQNVQRILFLPDESATYDFMNHRRRDNIRHPLRNDPVVRNFLDIAAKIVALQEIHSNGRMVTVPRKEMEALALRYEVAFQALLTKYLTVNDPCTCGSGRKVKKCCGLEVARQGRIASA